MFIVTEEEAKAVRQAYEQGGERAALAEFRRLFPGLAGNAKILQWVRAVASWREGAHKGGDYGEPWRCDDDRNDKGLGR